MPELIDKLTGSIKKLKTGVNVIGKSEECDIRLAYARENGLGVSDKHAEVTLSENSYFIQGLNSGNSTHLSNRKLKPEEKIQLNHGDIIRLGIYQLVFSK